MRSKDIQQIRAALEVVHESQNILFRLRASVSVSTGYGLKQYLWKTKIELIYKLATFVLKIWAIAIGNTVSTVTSKAIFVLRELWLGITGHIQ